MLWDPLGAWPAGRRWLWVGLAALVCFGQGPAFVRSLRPARDVGVDFFQEWASARNLIQGLPVYTSHEITAKRYLGSERSPGDEFIEWNAHPPTSILLGLPIAFLDYPIATLVWNLLSLAGLAGCLALVWRELGLRFQPWAIFPVLTLLLLCNPFRQQVNQGQINIVVLLLLTGVWVAERNEHPWVAGVLLGAATAIKLFPGFLFLFYLLRRKWVVVAAGLVSVSVLTLLTMAVLGVEAYRSYVLDVIPSVSQFRSGWLNASLVGFWRKAFDTGAFHYSRQVKPILHDGVLARTGLLLSVSAVLAAWARAVWRAQSRHDRDRAFGLSLTTMLLVSPISWDHYFLLLLLPCVLIWVDLPRSALMRSFFLVILCCLWVSPVELWGVFLPEYTGHAKVIVAPVKLLTLLSFQCYALLGLFLLDLAVQRKDHAVLLAERADSGAASMIPSPPHRGPDELSETGSQRLPGWYKRLVRLETFLFLGIWLVLMILPRHHFFGDPGSLWHIVLGERMLSSNELIRFDPFSFTKGGSPWVPQSWLAECLLAAVHRIGGLDSIMAVTVIGLATLYTWVARRLLRAGVHPLLVGLVMVMAATGASYHFHPRPHILTLALLSWTFAALCDFEVGSIPLRRLFWLIPVFIVWANVHGGMVAGVITMVLVVAGWSFAWLIGAPSPVKRPRECLALAFLVVACALAALVNPYGTELPRVWFALVGSPVLPRLIQEHMPMYRVGAPGLAVVPIASFYVAALAGVPLRRLRITWLVPLAWLAFTWSRMRNGPLFAIVAAIALADLLPESRWVHWLSSRGSEVFRIRPADTEQARARLASRWVLLPIVLLVVSLGIQALALRIPLLGRGWASLHADSNPVELLPDLRAYEQSHPVGTPVFNEMVFAGFLVYSTPGLRVFIDDRCELYGDQFLLEYQNALLRDPARLDRWAQEYGFDAALTGNGTGFDRYLATAQAWVPVNQTPKATFYRRLHHQPPEPR